MLGWAPVKAFVILSSPDILSVFYTGLVRTLSECKTCEMYCKCSRLSECSQCETVVSPTFPTLQSTLSFSLSCRTGEASQHLLSIRNHPNRISAASRHRNALSNSFKTSKDIAGTSCRVQSVCSLRFVQLLSIKEQIVSQ